ncbi:flagellar hook-basal body complex protein FliE [Gracilinema caldarium]|uniref:flagellar hook-basal body complex protein FliE n=1 Tax=Gracilinema caldarium TaxID=215591 RepID=UPI0026E948FF|nr:flagellar hook-basal body complex protein FliE [Gracilinema caldarium]
MTIYKPELVSGDKIPMAVTNPRHLVPMTGQYQASGTALSELGNKVGAEAVLRSGSFEDAMLKALDSVNADQNLSTDLMETMVTDPDSVDPHDVTIAMAKANLSLNITRTVLDRIVKGWKEIINTR